MNFEMNYKISIIFDTEDWDVSVDAPLRKATGQQIVNIHDTLAKESLRNSICLRDLYAEYKDRLYLKSSEPSHDRKQGYIMIPEFGFSDEVAPCYTGKRPSGNIFHEICAHNLRTGKCQDPFMRATIGAVLFPEFYAREKQK